MKVSIMDRFKQASMGVLLALMIGSVVILQTACTSAQVQNVVNRVDQYLPTALSVATDIIAMLPMLTSQVSAGSSATYIKDAQGFSDAVGVISSDVAAYLSSKSSAALAKLADSVNAAKASIQQLLTDVHVVNAALQQKIIAYANLASTVLTTLASVVASGTPAAAVKALAAAPFSPAQAQAQLAVIRNMPL